MKKILLAIRRWWSKGNNSRVWRVYYPDNTRTRRITWYEAQQLSLIFKGRLEYDPYD